MANMTEEDFKQITEKYFHDRSLICRRIPEAKKVRTPDYEITRIPQISTHLAELKAPELNLNPNTGVYMHLTKIRKLREFIQKGSSQFISYNKSHDKLRILVFNSSHFQFHGKNLLEALHGYIPNNDGTLMADFRNDPIVRSTASYIKDIDAYIWLQISPQNKTPYQATLITNTSSPHLSKIKIFISELTALPLSNMDQSFLI